MFVGQLALIVTMMIIKHWNSLDWFCCYLIRLRIVCGFLSDFSHNKLKLAKVGYALNLWTVGVLTGGKDSIFRNNDYWPYVKEVSEELSYCILLHVLIHLLWCYYSFHFHLLARHTRNVHTWCSTPLNASSHPQFSWWNELLIHLHYNDVKPQDFSFPFPSAWTSHFSA